LLHFFIVSIFIFIFSLHSPQAVLAVFKSPAPLGVTLRLPCAAHPDALVAVARHRGGVVKRYRVPAAGCAPLRARFTRNVGVAGVVGSGLIGGWI
jgi:hypothetical protein